MANSDAPFGLRPVRHLSGGVIRMSEYPLATAGNNIYTNDLVALATGRVNQAAAGGGEALGNGNGTTPAREPLGILPQQALGNVG